MFLVPPPSLENGAFLQIKNSSFLLRKVLFKQDLAGLLTRGFTPLPLPGNFQWTGAATRIQWRDRAGISPASLLCVSHQIFSFKFWGSIYQQNKQVNRCQRSCEDDPIASLKNVIQIIYCCNEVISGTFFMSQFKYVDKQYL
jgi:hypothetical protein